MQNANIIKNPLFEGVHIDEIDHVLHCLHAYTKRYEKGETILHRGECISHVGILTSGNAHIIKDDYWGNRSIIKEIKENELFGEAYACIPNQPLEISLLATTPCAVLFLDISSMITMCEHVCHYHQRIIQNLLKIAAYKNRLLTQKMEHLTKRTTREKILSYLFSQSLQRKTKQIVIPFNRQQLADYLSVDRSALSNELSKMQKEGLLHYHKNTFTL